MPDATKSEDVAVPTDPKELRKLLERAHKGDERTLPVLRELLKAPGMTDACGNLAAHAERAFVDKAAGKDLAFREALLRKLAGQLLTRLLAKPAPGRCLQISRPS